MKNLLVSYILHDYVLNQYNLEPKILCIYLFFCNVTVGDILIRKKQLKREAWENYMKQFKIGKGLQAAHLMEIHLDIHLIQIN